MLKVPFFMCLPCGKLKDSLFALNLEGLEVFEEQGGIQIIRLSKGTSKYIFAFRRLEEKIDFKGIVSSSKDQKWDFWGVHPLGTDNDKTEVDFDWQIGTKLFRDLTKENAYEISGDIKENRILGPWCAKALELVNSELSDRIFYSQIPDKIGEKGEIISYKKDTNSFHLPWVMFGDAPEDLATIEYKPSVLDVMQNKEPVRSVLFPSVRDKGREIQKDGEIR